MSISMLLTLLNQIKIYHWQTNKHSEHVELDNLYKSLSDSIDDYVEVFMGKTQSRIKASEGFNLKLENYTSIKDIFTFLDKYISYISATTENLDSSELSAIKDDMLIAINKFKYLMLME